MAIKPTIFKANLQIADMDRHYYNDHLLTIAQHPSETDERMMVRMLAFVLNANSNLSFAEGISDQSQPDLWDKDVNGDIALWINVGLPDEKLIRKAISKATQVIIYSYGGRPAEVWWNKSKFGDYKNLQVFNLTTEDTQTLATMAARGMKMNFTIQEGEVMISNDNSSINIKPIKLK